MPHPKTILVVDDDSDVRESVTDLLELYGYRVIAACDGRSALVQLKDAAPPPSLILLDLVMPVLDGWSFLKRARRNRRLAGVPIVIITGENTSEVPGATAVLRKPVAPEALLARVEQLLR
ncbi:MAG: response regulator [Candidatus Binataceae bacterium]